MSGGIGGLAGSGEALLGGLTVVKLSGSNNVIAASRQ